MFNYAMVSWVTIMGMKTGVKSRAEVREEAILVGARIIHEHGFREFSLRRVAREIGYSVGSLYNVFEDQYDFILHINAKTLDDMHKFIDSRLRANQAHGVGRLRAIAYSYLEFAQHKYKLWCVLFDDSVIARQVTPEWYMQRVNKLFAIIEDALISTNQEIKNPREYVCTLWSAVHGVCTLSLSGKLQPAWLDTPFVLIDNLINNYTNGLLSIKK